MVVAVAPHPHMVAPARRGRTAPLHFAPARRKPNQGNAPSLTRVVACEHTKLIHPIADT